MKLSDEDKQGLSQDEIKALEQADDTDLADAVNVDGKTLEEAVNGDEKKPEGEQGAEGAQKEGEGEGEGALAAEDLDLIKDDEPAAQRQPVKFEVDQRDFAAELKTIRTERSGIEEKWSAGEITDEQRVAQLDTLEEKRDAVLAEQARATTLAEINQQNAQKAEQARIGAEDSAILALMAADEKADPAARLSYRTDASAQKDFDAALAAVKSSATHASKSPAEHVQAAHKMVMAMRGIAAAPAPAAATPAAAPAPKPPRDVPVGLGGLPNAGRAAGDMGDDNFAKFSSLNGEAAERFLAGLPEHEVDRLTNLADSKMFSR